MIRLVLLLLFLMMTLPVCRTDAGMSEHPTAQEIASRINGAVQIILEEAQKALTQHHDTNRYRFFVEPGWIPGSLTRISEEAIVSVTPTTEPERHTTFRVRYLDGNRHREADVQLRLTIETKVPVTAERIPAGTRINTGLLVLRWVEVSRDRGQLVMDADELEGMTLRRTLAMGEPVRRSDITTDYLVKAGDTVDVIFFDDGMQIILSATARQNGAENEDIRVYSEQTRRTYLATVRSPGEVEWKRTL